MIMILELFLNIKINLWAKQISQGSLSIVRGMTFLGEHFRRQKRVRMWLALIKLSTSAHPSSVPFQTSRDSRGKKNLEFSNRKQCKHYSRAEIEKGGKICWQFLNVHVNLDINAKRLYSSIDRERWLCICKILGSNPPAGHSEMFLQKCFLPG